MVGKGVRGHASWLDAQSRSGLIIHLWAAGEIALAAGRPLQAARLVGASIGLRERVGGVVEWFNAPALDRFLCETRSELGEAAFTAAIAAGRALPLDDAIAEGLTVLSEVADDPE